MVRLPETAERRPLDRGGAPKLDLLTAIIPDQAGIRQPEPATVAAVFDRADLIVRRMRATLDWLSWHGRAEYDRGYRDGYERAAADLERARREFARPTARLLAGGVDLLERRWGPGGRRRFGDPRPGDFPGRGDAA